MANRAGFDPPPPFASLVLLLARPRLLPGRVLRRTVNEALGASLDIDGAESTDRPTFLIGERPPFALHLDEQLYLVHAFPTPYWELSDRVAAQLSDRAQRRAVRLHRAWLSVDAICVESEERRTHAFRQIARLIAALADPSCLAVHAPATELLLSWSQELGNKLAASTSPLDTMAEASIEAWVRAGDG